MGFYCTADRRSIRVMQDFSLCSNEGISKQYTVHPVVKSKYSFLFVVRVGYVGARIT